MPINQSDIKLVTAQVMDDVPEGGGGPSSHEVVNGASNEIFADISEADRAIGRVSQRKVHVTIQSEDVDTYLGANMIVAEPPNDPNVSITIFSTGDVFDTRTEATNRLQSYLSVGSAFPGYLYGNHITGMRTLQIIQRTDELPSINDRLVLTKRGGYVNEFTQYVSITEASVVKRTFTDDRGDFERYVLTVKLGDALRADFTGFDAARAEPSKGDLALYTKISDDIVADAARYYGVVALEEPASIGEFTIKAEGIFTQLVPSAQVETAIADARTNQLSAALVAAGAPITVQVAVNLVLGQPTSAFVGGGIMPGTVLVGGLYYTGTTDRDGVLYNGGNPYGTIDYENGVLYLPAPTSVAVGAIMTITYQPSAVPLTVSQSQGFVVTAENRAINHVRTLPTIPARGSLSISYSVAGKWYVLRDAGSGELRGSDSSYGAGLINFTTGTAQVTLGALPDVGSAVIYQWSEAEVVGDTSDIVLDNNGRFYWPFNTSGEMSLNAGSKAIKPGSLLIAWGAGLTATDDGAGNIVGLSATGTVNYAKGTIRFSPNVMPARGTSISVTTDAAAKVSATLAVASGNGSFGVTNITPGSISFILTGQIRFQYQLGTIKDYGPPISITVVDDGVGGLVALIGNTRTAVGSVNYSAGTFSLNSDTLLSLPTALVLTMFDNIFLASDDIVQLAMFSETA